MEKALFAAGCFWGVQAEFKKEAGVLKTTVGYSGGQTENPTYEQVCKEDTGHAEVVLIEFDPQKVSYAELLKIFWEKHDPTTLNQQGPDRGTQYRSAIFYFDEKQKTTAQDSLKEAQSKRTQPIVTEITPASRFYKAEAYHQDYLDKHSGSCPL